MRRELDYFRIGDSLGGCQEWFTDFMMKLGGCAALAACESCIYLALRKGKQNLYPFDEEHLSREDYVRFGMEMKPYLRPRLGGVNRLELYVDGFGGYLRARGETGLSMEAFSGEHTGEEAKERVAWQIDKGYPIPCLTLCHRNPAFKNYVWHWYMLAGYERFEGQMLVKAVTYSRFRWLDFGQLWETGHRKRGGLILYRP